MGPRESRYTCSLLALQFIRSLRLSAGNEVFLMKNEAALAKDEEVESLLFFGIVRHLFSDDCHLRRSKYAYCLAKLHQLMGYRVGTFTPLPPLPGQYSWRT